MFLIGICHILFIYFHLRSAVNVDNNVDDTIHAEQDLSSLTLHPQQKEVLLGERQTDHLVIGASETVEGEKNENAGDILMNRLV